MTKVWITKYALTTSIWTRDAKIKDDLACVGNPGTFEYQCFFREGREWHRTHESAVARAEEMRLAKIASLRKAIERLEQLRFAP
jgi:hypothetical protein